MYYRKLKKLKELKRNKEIETIKGVKENWRRLKESRGTKEIRWNQRNCRIKEN